MDSNKNFLDILFNEDEFICPCALMNDHGKPISVKTIKQKNYIFSPKDQWISLNPYNDYSTRCIENLKYRRNFLLEIDVGNMHLEDQLNYFVSFNTPISLCTFSGNKSYHFIISLENSISLKDYKRACTILKFNMSLIDKACLEPSTFTRMAGATRSNGAIQDLEFYTGRINNDLFFQWLATLKQPSSGADRQVIKIKKQLSTFTKHLLKNGIKAGKTSRHDKIKAVAIDMFLSGISQQEAEKAIVPALVEFNDDKDEEEAIRMIHWVYHESDLSQI